MSLPLVLVVMAALVRSESGHLEERQLNSTDPNGPSSNINGSYNIQSFSGPPPHNHVAAILYLLKILEWAHVIVLYDHSHSDDLQLLLPVLGLTSVYDLDDLQSDVEVRQLFRQLHRKFFPKLYFLLLSNSSRAMELLHTIELFDLESQRTTDYRHFSYWIVTCYSPCQPSTGALPRIHHLENVVLVSYLWDCHPSLRQFINPRLADLETEEYVFPIKKSGQNRTGHEDCHPVLRHLRTSPEGRYFSGGADITRVQNEHDIFPNTRYGLNNRTLIVTTKESSSFVIKTATGYEGYCISVLNAIATALNFSYKIIQPPDKQWGGIVNGSWNGLVGQLERRDVDLMVATIAINEDREKVMDFLYPPFFTMMDDIIYRVSSEDTQSWQIFLKPFHPLVHFMFFLTLLVSTLVGYILFCFEPARKKKYSGVWSVILEMQKHFMYLLGTMLTRALDAKPKRQSTRLFVFTWGVFSVILAACYSANLVAIFTVHKQEIPFSNLGELVRQTEYKWGIQAGAIREHIFSQSRAGDQKLYWEGIVKFNKTDPGVLNRQRSAHIAKVKSEKYVFVTSRLTIERMQQEDCSIRAVGQDVLWHQIGIGVPTGYPLSRQIENVLSTITDSGLLDVWWRRWGPKNTEKCIYEDTTILLTLHDVASAFYILCIGLGAAGVALVIEYIYYKLNPPLM